MLSILTVDDLEKWENIVKTFENYDVYYLANYTKAFQMYGDGKPLLFYYEDSCMKAINVVMKRDISHDERFKGKIAPNTYFDLATPYGYGGFLMEGNINEKSIKSLNTQYSNACKDKEIISEIVRFHPVLKNASRLVNVYDIHKLGETVTMNLTSKNDIWNNLKTNKKRWIKKAKTAGVEIYWGRDPQLFDDFKSMYYMTMEKNQARDYYYFNDDFFQSIINDLRYNAIIFYAVYEGKKIAMVLVLHGNGQLHHHFSASHPDYQQLASTNLLMYEIANWGSENGYKTFHLGGGVGSRNDSLYQFKSGFNKNSTTTFQIGMKIFNHVRYEELNILRNLKEDILENENYFPTYRI